MSFPFVLLEALGMPVGHTAHSLPHPRLRRQPLPTASRCARNVRRPDVARPFWNLLASGPFSLTQRRGEAENAEVHWVDRVVSFSVIVSIFLSALSASPHLCVRSRPHQGNSNKGLSDQRRALPCTGGDGADSARRTGVRKLLGQSRQRVRSSEMSARLP